MLGHPGALIPGQRPAQVRGQPVHRVEQGVPQRGGGVTGRQRHRAQVAAHPLHQGTRGLAVLADDQVAFPAAGHLAARHLGGPVLDGAHAGDLRARAFLRPRGLR
jgi:hypothetical protein